MCAPQIDSGSERDTAVRRRTVVAGSAWAIPAVVAVNAAPAIAASSLCVAVYPFTVSGIKASWTNTIGATVTLSYTVSVPLSSVFNTNVTQTPSGGSANTVAYQPTNATSYTFASGGTLISTAAAVAAGTMTWTATVSMPVGVTLTLGTQAGPCQASAPSASVQVTSPVLDCPFTYPIDCPF